MTTGRIVIAGAGSIGCYVGGALALSGVNVTLLARPGLAGHIRQHGLRLTDLDGLDRRVAPSNIRLGTEASAALGEATLILVTVKSGDTSAMADLIATHAPKDALVLSLQNGVDNVPLLRSTLGRLRVIAGMVPFNVAQSHRDGEAPHFHRATSGKVLIDSGHEAVLRLLDVEGLGGVGLHRASRHGVARLVETGAQHEQRAECPLRSAAAPAIVDAAMAADPG